MHEKALKFAFIVTFKITVKTAFKRYESISHLFKIDLSLYLCYSSYLLYDVIWYKIYELIKELNSHLITKPKIDIFHAYTPLMNLIYMHEYSKYIDLKCNVKSLGIL